MYLCAEIPRLSHIYIYIYILYIYNLGDCIVETNICKCKQCFVSMDKVNIESSMTQIP